MSALIIAAAIEFSACRDHWLNLRWVAALIADVMVLALISLEGLPAALVVGAAFALLAIHTGSTIARTLVGKLRITWFETVQFPAAFSLVVSAALQFKMGLTVGLLCICASLAGYAISLLLRDRRNFFTYSSFAILLMITAGWLLLSGAALAGLFAALAVATIRSRHRTLRVHATVYLLLSAAVAQIVQLASERLIHTGARVESGVTFAYLLASLGALLCYLAVSEPLKAVLPAGLLCLGGAGLTAGWIQAAPLRTALLTALAIGIAWCGRRWARTELVWLAYPLLALAGVKLIAEDFRQGRSTTLFLSLIFFGGALILLPRLLRRTSVMVEDQPIARAASQH